MIKENVWNGTRPLLPPVTQRALKVDLVINAGERKPASAACKFNRTVGLGAFCVEPIAIILAGKPLDAAFGLRYQNVLSQRINGSIMGELFATIVRLCGVRQYLDDELRVDQRIKMIVFKPGFATQSY